MLNQKANIKAAWIKVIAWLILMLFVANVGPALADSKKCREAKRALAAAEAELKVRKKIRRDAAKKVIAARNKENAAANAYRAAWKKYNFAYTGVMLARANLIQRSFSFVDRITNAQPYKDYIAAKKKFDAKMAKFKQAEAAAKAALKKWRAAQKALDEASKAYSKAYKAWVRQVDVVFAAQLLVEKVCKKELNKLLKGIGTGKSIVIPGGKGNTKSDEKEDKKNLEGAGSKNSGSGTLPGKGDNEGRKPTGGDKGGTKDVPGDKGVRPEKENKLNDNNGDDNDDASLEELFEEFGMNDGSGVIREYTGRANEANTEDIAIEEARRRGFDDDDDGGGGGTTPGGGGSGNVAMTNATFSAQCDVNAGVGTNTLSANGTAFCSTSTLAGGTANISCVPGSTVTISAACTATTCRAFVNSFANLTCPFAAPGFITGGFGGAGGFGTNASINCTCQ